MRIVASAASTIQRGSEKEANRVLAGTGLEMRSGPFVRDERTGEGSVTVHQDVALYAALLDPGTRVEHALGRGRHAWLQVARGAVTLNQQPLAAGDGAAISDQSALTIAAGQPSEVLLFDLA